MDLNSETAAATHHHQHEVKVIVDGLKIKVEPGTYVVADFKALVKVPPTKELDEIVHGVLKPLDDNSQIKISGHEHFVSHERCGGSS